MVTEGRPDDTGVAMAKALDELGIPVTLILDSAVAYSLERCVAGRLSGGWLCLVQGCDECMSFRQFECAGTQFLLQLSLSSSQP